MSDRSQGRSAIEVVGAYHEDQLADLLGHVADAVAQFGRGELSAIKADGVMFQYSRAAKKLWSFCHVGSARNAAQSIADSVEIDWWARGSYRER